jgi:uncharacterized protein DUF2721
LNPDDVTSDLAHLIQTALTPVFLLSGIGSLLNVFNARLAKVSDQLRDTAHLLEGQKDAVTIARLLNHISRLTYRHLMLDASIALGAVGGASTCGAAFVLFLGSVRDSSIGTWLIVLFASALGCTVCSLVAFLADSLLAWHGLRREGPLPRAVTAPSAEHPAHRP